MWLEGSGLAGAIGFLMAGLGNHIVAIVGGLLLVIALVGVAVGIPVADRGRAHPRAGMARPRCTPSSPGLSVLRDLAVVLDIPRLVAVKLRLAGCGVPRRCARQ